MLFKEPLALFIALKPTQCLMNVIHRIPFFQQSALTYLFKWMTPPPLALIYIKLYFRLRPPFVCSYGLRGLLPSVRRLSRFVEEA